MGGCHLWVLIVSVIVHGHSWSVRGLSLAVCTYHLLMGGGGGGGAMHCDLRPLGCHLWTLCHHLCVVSLACMQCVLFVSDISIGGCCFGLCFVLCW